VLELSGIVVKDENVDHVTVDVAMEIVVAGGTLSCICRGRPSASNRWGSKAPLTGPTGSSAAFPPFMVIGGAA
jgi:hypothetical protein